MKLIILFSIILYNHSVWAQTVNSTAKDTNYITSRASEWSLRAYTVSKYNRFVISDPDAKARFYPGFKLGTGLGISFYNVALDIAINTYSSAPALKSQDLGLISALYFNQYLVNVELQLYNYNTIFIKDATNEVSIKNRTDITVFNAGINYNYNFNYRKFSFNAPFIGTQVQKQTSGTFLAGVFLNYFDLHSDSSVVPTVTKEFNSQSMITKADLVSTGLTAGYAFTWILPYHFYITLSFTPKVGLSTGEIVTTGRSVPFGVTPGFLSRNSIGYAGKRFYGLLYIMGDYTVFSLGGNDELYYDPLKVKFLIGYRFN